MKKRVLSIALAFALSLTLAPVTFASDYAEIVPPKYDDVRDFSEGFAAIAVRSYDNTLKWGFIDKTGREVLPPKYSEILDFSEGLAAVSIGDWESGFKWGFIDTAGTEVVAPKYSDVRSFSEGMAAFGIGDWESGFEWGFINATGEEVITAQYESVINDFSDGIAVVRNAMWRPVYIDMTGNEVDRPPSTQTDSLILKRDLDTSKFGFVDAADEVVIPLIYDDARSFSDGMAAIAYGEWSLDEWEVPRFTGKWGFINEGGNEVIPAIYDSVRDFSEGLAAVSNDGNWGFVNKTGNLVTHLEFVNALDFFEGFACVTVIEERPCPLCGVAGARHYVSGYIGKTGELIVPYEYADARKVSEGMAAVRDGEKLFCDDHGSDWGQWGFIALSDSGTVPTSPTDGAQSSLVAELEEAIDLGFIPDSMIGNWTQPTNRLLAAEMIVMLIEALLDKSIDEVAVEKGFDMTDKFSDSDSMAVTFLKASGISNGVGDNNYSPDGTYNRAQMMTMLGRMAERVFDMDLSVFQLGTDVFTDVPSYADQYVGWAAEVQITLGMGDGRFGSDNDLENQHTGAFTLRAYKYFVDN